MSSEHVKINMDLRLQICSVDIQCNDFTFNELHILYWIPDKEKVGLFT